MATILDAIDNYISNRMYRYALMINGEWGSGKTYFVENELIPHIEAKGSLKATYISLYGVNEASTISDTVYA